MDNLRPEYFNDFFTEIYGNTAFPWQNMLVEQIAAEQGKWPQSIDLPTASGKTACIDVAVFLLALAAQDGFRRFQAPRRIFFVVDRRIVVDEAYDRASKLSQALSDPPGPKCQFISDQLRAISGGGVPLVAARMRGGLASGSAGGSAPSSSPLQPAVITSTVDQIGSRLLFRSYGGRRLAAPIHAALAAFDSLIILDEAHCAKPFSQTVARVHAYLETAPQRLALPLQLVRMSATNVHGGASGQCQAFPPASLRKKALDCEELHRRLSATKKVQLANAGAKSDGAIQTAAKCANQALDRGRKRIAIMFNRVSLAHEAAELLKTSPAQVELLTGRMRPFDRDRQVQRLLPVLRASNPEDSDRPVVVVTTQCLEVGADLSFDHIVTECASLDALVQRFGRLNRLGRQSGAGGIVLAPPTQRGAASDPIYGDALSATWEFLKGTAEKSETRELDFSPSAIADWLGAIEPEKLGRLVAPSPCAPELLPVHLDILCQTAPRPVPDVDVPALLHGLGRGDAEVRVVFRADLSENFFAMAMAQESTPDERLNGYFELCPVHEAECFTVPLDRMRAYLRNGNGSSKMPPDLTDVEGQASDDGSANPKRDDASATNGVRQIVRCRDGEWSCIGTEDRGAIAPGDLIALPVPRDGGIPVAIGTVPSTAPIDIGEEASMGSDAGGENGHLYLRINRDTLRRYGLLTDGNLLDQWLAETAAVPADEPDAVQLTDAIANAVNSYGGVPSTFMNRLRVAVESRAAKARLYPNPLADTGGRDREFILVWSGYRNPEDTISQPDAQSEAPAPVKLSSHLADVHDLANRFAARLPAEIRDAIAFAAGAHDLGKLETRFQEMLCADGEPLAKSVTASGGVEFRHEMVSMAILETYLAEQLPQTDILRDLVLHLVAAHHGYGRPLAPYRHASGSEFVDAPDFDPAIIQWSAKDAGVVPAHHLASGVAERFWRLTRHYGWWGLAILEATVRLADWAASSDQNHHTVSQPLEANV